jgi:hypothetical protein
MFEYLGIPFNAKAVLEFSNVGSQDRIGDEAGKNTSPSARPLEGHSRRPLRITYVDVI